MDFYKDLDTIKSVEALDNLKAEFNEAIEKRRVNLIREQQRKELINKNFNYIKESFEGIAPSLYMKEGGSKYLAKYVKTIQENKNLNTLHKICEAIRISDRECDAHEYLSDVINLCGNITESYKEDVAKLGKILSEACAFIGDVEGLLAEDKNVNEAIEYVAAHPKTIKNIVNYNNHAKLIENYIRENGNTYTLAEKKQTLESFTDAMNEKYKELSEGEKKVFKLIESGQNEEAFNSIKNLCLSTIKEKMDSTTGTEKDKLNEVYNNTSNKRFVLESLKTDIGNFVNLIGCLVD